MEPDLISPAQWDQIGRAMVSLYIFTGLALNAALSFLLGHAIIPSLVASGDAPAESLALRRVLDPVFALSLLLTLVALGWAMYLAVDALWQIYPRFWI